MRYRIEIETYVDESIVYYPQKRENWFTGWEYFSQKDQTGCTTMEDALIVIEGFKNEQIKKVEYKEVT